MELSERYIQKLEREGFDSVYEWQDKPGVFYPEHTHDYSTTIIITDGSLILTIRGKEKVLKAGDRAEIPAGVPHSARAGEKGVIYIVGEKHNP